MDEMKIESRWDVQWFWVKYRGNDYCIEINTDHLIINWYIYDECSETLVQDEKLIKELNEAWKKIPRVTRI